MLSPIYTEMEIDMKMGLVDLLIKKFLPINDLLSEKINKQ